MRGFRGHNCQHMQLPPSHNKLCQLSTGAKSAEGVTTTQQDYAQFQQALHYFSIMLDDKLDFERLCVDLLNRMEKGGVCQQKFPMYWKGVATNTGMVTLNCHGQGELFVVLTLCTKPCMTDIHNTCACIIYPSIVVDCQSNQRIGPR